MSSGVVNMDTVSCGEILDKLMGCIMGEVGEVL